MNKLEQELNKFLAEEIMGWDYYTKENWTEDFYWVGHASMNNNDWNPLTNLEQAFGVLKKYDRYFHMINTTSDAVHDSSAEMKVDNGFVTHESNNPCELIVGCILKAKSKFEEFEEVFE